MPRSQCASNQSKSNSRGKTNACFFNSPRTLAILPIWFAFLNQCLQTLLRIFQAIQLVQKNILGMFESIAKRHSHAAKDGFFGHSEHGTGMSGHPGYEILHRCFELSFRYQPIDQSKFQRALRSDWFAGEHKLQCNFWSDEIRKDRGRERRKHADGNFW